MRVAWIALSLFAAMWSGSAAGARVAESGLTSVDHHFTNLHQARRFNGLVLVSVGDSIVLQRSYGLADFEHQTPITAQSIFRMGSLTKPVTASAILRSIAAGHMSLDDRLCDGISSCLPAWSNVTLEHLLSHTSGIPDHFGDLRAVPVDETAAELARAISEFDQAEAVRSEPGSAYDYSNFNYVLAAAMLEQAEGRKWREIVRGLADAIGAPTLDYDDVYAIVPHRVRGYGRREDGELRNIDYDDHAAHAAGGLRATAGDFLRWSRAALDARLFPARLRDEMLTPRHGNYGLGWQIREFHGRRVYNHTGGIDGFATHIAYYPADDLTILVLTNVEPDPAILFACDTAALIFDVPAARERPSEHFAAMQPRARCGVAG